MQRVLIIIGLLLVVIGLLWPIVAKLGIGRLPGDFMVDRGNIKFYFPLTSSILVSALAALLLWLIRK